MLEIYNKIMRKYFHIDLMFLFQCQDQYSKYSRFLTCKELLQIVERQSLYPLLLSLPLISGHTETKIPSLAGSLRSSVWLTLYILKNNLRLH